MLLSKCVECAGINLFKLTRNLIDTDFSPGSKIPSKSVQILMDTGFKSGNFSEAATPISLYKRSALRYNLKVPRELVRSTPRLQGH